jgi:hypothetical protein
MGNVLKVGICYNKLDLWVVYDLPEGMKARDGFEMLDVKLGDKSIVELLSDKVSNEIMERAIEVLEGYEG